MSANPLRILLIDNDEDTFVLTRSLLSRVAGTAFEVEWASSYDAGLGALREGRHDACLLDYRLGAGDGMELLHQASAEGWRAPIIMLTGQGDHGIDLQAIKAGAADYLVKGQLTDAVLERAIRYAIERSGAIEERLRNEAHLRLLTEQLRAMLWATDCHLRFTSSLGAGLPGLKLRPNEAIGRSLFDFFQTEDPNHPAIMATRRALLGESATFEIDWLERTYRGYVESLRQIEGYIVGTIGVALDITHHRQVEEEFRAARKIQQSLLPAHSPVLPGFDIAGACHPAAATGGDYFDYISLPDGSLGIVIADVSKHGFAPALIMAGTRRLLRTLAERSSDISEILTSANRAIAEDTQPEHFVTLFFAQLNPQTRTLIHAGAGHEGFVLEATGNVNKLESTTLPLGIDPGNVIPCGQPTILEPGQLVVMLTDGIDEAMAPDEHLFGIQRALNLVHAHRERPAAEILALLYQAVRDFCHPNAHHDDVTAVIVKVEEVR
jgi:FixJ family two-component response regulator